MGKVMSIEMFRAIAMILVLIYHVWVYSGYPDTGYNTIVGYGGEIGVTLFFIISGFAIFMNIEREIQKKQEINYLQFIKKRAIKLIPPYYLAMFIMIFLSNSSYLLNSTQGLADIFLHSIFLHNIFVSTHGSINGAFWTLAVIFQFYFIAIFIYKILKKYPKSTLIGAILITILYKYVVFNFIGNEAEGIKYFIYGRQLIGCLDNFVIGMFLAYNYLNKKDYNEPTNLNKKLFILIEIVLIYFLLKCLNHYTLYTNSYFAYIWHSLLAISMYCLMKTTLKKDLVIKNLLSKAMIYISKIEYGIYIWHLPILIILAQNTMLNKLNPISKFYILTVIVTLLSCIWGDIYLSFSENILIKFKIMKKI